MEYFVKEGWQLNPNEKIVKGITKAIERSIILLYPASLILLYITL